MPHALPSSLRRRPQCVVDFDCGVNKLPVCQCGSEKIGCRFIGWIQWLGVWASMHDAVASLADEMVVVLLAKVHERRSNSA